MKSLIFFLLLMPTLCLAQNDLSIRNIGEGAVFSSAEGIYVPAGELLVTLSPVESGKPYIFIMMKSEASRPRQINSMQVRRVERVLYGETKIYVNNPAVAWVWVGSVLRDNARNLADRRSPTIEEVQEALKHQLSLRLTEPQRI